MSAIISKVTNYLVLDVLEFDGHPHHQNEANQEDIITMVFGNYTLHLNESTTSF